MEKRVFNVKGMHCSSCELLIEDELMKIPYVCSARVDQNNGLAEVYFENHLNDKDVEKAVKQAGYELGIDEKPWFSKDSKKYLDLIKAGVLLFALYSMVATLGLFKLSLVSGGSYSSLPVVFLVGLTAGLSTCMALVGGLVLGISAKYSQNHTGAKPWEKFKPHVFFNLGRIIAFFIFGGVLGYAGSIFQFSLTTTGLLTVAVGVTMAVLGIQLLEISPKINRFKFTLPKFIARLFGVSSAASQNYSHKNSAILGMLTFFLPCGFTQAMQLYAVSTGSATAGALTMGVFALGTTPGLLSLGGLTSLIKGVYSRLFFKTVGLAVLGMALFNIKNGYNLAGFKLSEVIQIDLSAGQRFSRVQTAFAQNTQPLPPKVAIPPSCAGGGGGCGGCGGSAKVPGASSAPVAAQIQGTVQVIKSTYSAQNDMSPNNFSVKLNQPVRLEVVALDDGFGCMGSIAIPKLSTKTEIFQKGKTVSFEFTPKLPGKYPITCAMGIPHGEINVI